MSIRNGNGADSGLFSTVPYRIAQGELESYLWGAATLLRGLIDAGDYKQYIFPLLFFKRICDVYDEEIARALAESGGDADYAAYAENHRFQIPLGAHWTDVRTTSANLGMAIQDAMRSIETSNPDKLYGIFGDAQWTNKDRLSDETLRDLIEHFSLVSLSLTNVPEDELGVTYEFLIKKFADDSGHTAAEFYTNRTVVHLMTLMLEPQERESIYDPTCGSGGMLLSAAMQLKSQGKEYRNLRLFGQERNLLTSAIARMNLFLHGFEDFEVVRGDTLAEPKLLDGDRLRQFDLCLANPPYSIKAWNRAAWAKDPYGRNLWGVPPQGRADYAFWEHIIASLKPDTGRCAILFPHGVLFRDEERQMREKVVQSDVIECVVGLGPNLFYNSPMEACIIVCRMCKPAERRGKIAFINAVNEVSRERAQSFLNENHIQRIVGAYRAFADEDGFARIASVDEIGKNDFSLNMPIYVRPAISADATAMPAKTLTEVIADWQASSLTLRRTMTVLFDQISTAAVDKAEKTQPTEPRITLPMEHPSPSREELGPAPTPIPISSLRFSLRDRVRAEVRRRYSEVAASGRFRHSAPSERDLFKIIVWVARGEMEAGRLQCAPYDEVGFWNLLTEARGMTGEHRDKFLPTIVETAARCGVAVVFVPVRAGVRANGFTRWLTPTKALLMTSDRHKYTDSFWFTFFHEAGHIIRHDKNLEFLESDEGEKVHDELEADRFAEDLLIPRPVYLDMAAAKPQTAAEITMWAERLGVSPGVVVGRLHHEGLLPKRACNDLRQRFA